MSEQTRGSKSLEPLDLTEAQAAQIEAAIRDGTEKLKVPPAPIKSEVYRGWSIEIRSTRAGRTFCKATNIADDRRWCTATNNELVEAVKAIKSYVDFCERLAEPAKTICLLQDNGSIS